jgi:hypothetical protein
MATFLGSIKTEIRPGDRVKIRKEYGGGSGVVEDIVRGFAIVKTRGGLRSYHISDLKHAK